MLQEQQIINDCKLGKLKGIVELDDCFYIPLRVTGTGDSIRFANNDEPYIEERLKSHYFTPEILTACSHLPITLEHPKNGLLDSSTIDSTKIVGITLHSWIQDEEIWALGKIFDKRLIKDLGKKLGSTSPGFGVFCYIISSGEKVSEVPTDINHLALVHQGHWDQKEGSVGFDNSKIERRKDMQEVKPSGTAMELNDVVEAPKSVVEQAKLDGIQARLDAIDEKLAKRADEETEKKEELVEDVKVNEAEEVKADETGSLEEEVKADEGDEVLDSADVQPLQMTDDFGPEHHEQPSEPKVDEDTEIIESDSVEELDNEREALLEDMRETCDTAHPSLGVKMPHITMRETPRSIISKFMSRNPQFVNEKYQGQRVDTMSDKLADEVYKDMKTSIFVKSKSLGVNQVKGFVETSRGYSVDSSF